MDALDELRAAEVEWRQAQRAAASKYAARNAAVFKASLRGFTSTAIAAALGCTVGRVSQILGPKSERPAGGPRGAVTEKR